MITRRIVVLAALGAGLVLAAWAFAPGEFWNDKQPSDWSDKDVQRLLTKSPWAKEASVEFDFSAMGGPDGGPGPMGGGMPGGGEMGGPGMGGPGGGGPGGMGGPGGPGGGPPQSRALVRWESAAPIRDADKRQLPEDAAEYYVIGVSGLPMMDAGRPGAPAGGDPEKMQARLKESTSLRRKGKDPIAPVRVRISEAAGGLLFYFPRDAGPISIEEKEVVFLTTVGPLVVKAKFPLKEMTYRGKLAL
jgi:hypothetical protein